MILEFFKKCPYCNWGFIEIEKKSKKFKECKYCDGIGYIREGKEERKNKK